MLTKDDKQTIWIVAGIGAAILAVSFIFRKQIVKGVKSTMDTLFKNNMVNIALEEWAKWNKGSIKEGDPKTMEQLRKYWKEGAGVKNWSDARMINEAWSAAFISYVMRMAGAGADWKYSPSHSVYIREAIKNRKENNSNPFKGYKPEEIKVEVGDVVGRPRQSGVSYDTTGAYLSHTDIVTNIANGHAETIGGNVGQSVSKTLVPLKADGTIDNSKVKGYPYHVVIKNGK